MFIQCLFMISSLVRLYMLMSLAPADGVKGRVYGADNTDALSRLNPQNASRHTNVGRPMSSTGNKSLNNSNVSSS